MCCGGMLRNISHTFVGPISEQFFGELHAETVFLSASGITLEQGFTDPNMLQGQMKQAMAKAARKKIMLLDSNKFGNVSLRTTFQLTDIDVLVTDAGAPKDMISSLQDSGIEVHIADNEE